MNYEFWIFIILGVLLLEDLRKDFRLSSIEKDLETLMFCMANIAGMLSDDPDDEEDEDE